MKRNEIAHKMHDELEKINQGIEKLQNICNRCPDSLDAKEAEYAIHLLNLTKKDIQAPLNAFDAEYEDDFVETFAV